MVGKLGSVTGHDLPLQPAPCQSISHVTLLLWTYVWADKIGPRINNCAVNTQHIPG